MSTESKRSAERFKYGICLNEECTLSKSKTIQQISMRKELVCSECGKELRECAPPKSKSKFPVLIAIGVVTFIAIVAVLFMFYGGESGEGKGVETDSSSVEVHSDTVGLINQEPRIDTVKIEKVIEKETTPVEQKTTTTTTTTTKKSSEVGSGSLHLSYGTYTGATKGGYPHGQGRLTYSTNRQINRNDMKGRMASAGDYVIGEFFNGFVVYGKHYDANGNLLESLNFGVGSESSYESK